MSYGSKYRCEFKDYYSRDIKIDLLQDGYSSSVTSITPTDDPFTIEWPSDRANIFNPVRGGLATLNVYATTDNQFTEFFDSYETEYKMEVYVDGSLYWTGWVMPGDFQEPFDNAPYATTFKAYDLGYLQNIYYDKTLVDDDSIIDIIQECLDKTGFSFQVKDIVNIYENSVTSGVSYSILNVINIHQRLFHSDDFDSMSYYDVLGIILSSFNSFIIQENGIWNICRVSDMKYEHNYRIFNTSGSIVDSDTEDLTVDLSSHYIASRTGLYMSCPTWKTLNLKQDFGANNLVINGGFNVPGAPDYVQASDLFTKLAGGGSYYYTNHSGYYGGADSCLTFVYNTSAISIVQDKTYEIHALDLFRLKLRWNFKVDCVGGTGSCSASIGIKHDDGAGTVTYLQLDDGSWGSTLDVTTLAGLDPFTWYSGEIDSDLLPGAGTLSIILYEAGYKSGSTGRATYWDYVELTPLASANTYNFEDYSEEINSSNLNDSDEIVIYLGDSESGDNGGSLLAGTYTLTSGSATNLWQSLNGSVEDKLVQLCADCYKAQYEASTRRIQGTIIGQLNYLDVLTDNSKYYLASSMTRDFARSTMQGEWIEIKTGYIDITGTFINSASRPYDDFSTTTGEFSIIKSQTSAEATVTMTGVTATEGRRYRLTINIEDLSGSPYLETVSGETLETFDGESIEYTPSVTTTELPEFNFAGNNKDDFTLGETVWEVIATSTTSTFNTFCTHDTVTDTCDLRVTVKIEETYGL